MMKLGMPTLIECRSIEENVELCLQLGLQFIELNMNLPICLPENLSYDRLQRLKKQHQIDFTIHLPEEIDLSSFHLSIRRGHLERCKETIRWAKSAGITLVNMHIHNGIYFTLPDQKVWINEVYEKEFVDHLCASYADLYAYAKSYGVMLCIENATNFHYPFIQKALHSLSNYEGFYLTWDVGHDAKSGYQELQVLEKYMDRVRHIHLHDMKLDHLHDVKLERLQGVKAGNLQDVKLEHQNVNTSLDISKFGSDHQPLYTGIVPIEERLRFAEQRNLSVVVEVKTSEMLIDSIQRLKQEHLRNKSEG